MISLDVSDRITAIRGSFADIVSVVDIPALDATIEDLSEKAGVTDLWDDPAAAQKVTSALSHAQSQRGRIRDLQQRLDDLDVLLDMAKEADDDESAREVLAELSDLETLIGEMEVQTLLDGEYDSLPAIITIRAGAGGVDAAVRRDAVADVRALGGTTQAPRPGSRRVLRRRGGHQVGDHRSRCAVCVRCTFGRGRHAPTRSHEPV